AAAGSSELPEWMLVRAPAEEDIEIMGDKPLEYKDGWLHTPSSSLKVAELQLGDKVAARIDVPSHPVLDSLRALPPFKGGRKLPDWIVASVCELHTGKVGGVVKRGRFLVQRPSGAMPERIATEAAMLQVPKERARRTVLAAILGLGLSTLMGGLLHARA
ncbi:unnamed protein product, partial [Polarella glacialis]